MATLELAYTARLASIARLAECGVARVTFESIKTITDWDNLGACLQMESVRLSKMGVIPSLGFVTRMPNLREWRFVETTIADGDMSPLLGLESVAFDNNRRYSHTEEQVRQRIKARRSGSAL